MNVQQRQEEHRRYSKLFDLYYKIDGEIDGGRYGPINTEVRKKVEEGRGMINHFLFDLLPEQRLSGQAEFNENLSTKLDEIMEILGITEGDVAQEATGGK